MAQKDGHAHPAVFLDRDGVINVDKGYVHKVSDFEWIEGAREAIKYANDARVLVIVVTNQSGVARGYYSEEDVRKLHRWINRQLADIGARIDAFYYCPYHPEAIIPQYRRISDMRKPGPGMILKALAEWKIDKERSFLIGDSDRDIVAAERAGIRSQLFGGGDLRALMAKHIGTVLAEPLAATPQGRESP